MLKRNGAIPGKTPRALKPDDEIPANPSRMLKRNRAIPVGQCRVFGRASLRHSTLSLLPRTIIGGGRADGTHAGGRFRFRSSASGSDKKVMLQHLPALSAAERLKAFRKRNPGYDAARMRRQRAAVARDAQRQRQAQEAALATPTETPSTHSAAQA